MRAVTFTRFGGPEVLAVTEVPTPEPAAGQVRIRVEAAAVNPVDVAARSGVFGAPVPLGWDVAGVVDALGPGGTAFSVGQRVIGLANVLAGDPGTHAEYVVLDAAALAPAPSGVPAVEAATVPLNALTAAQAVDLLGLRAGQSVAVTGAAGAVGGYAIALAARAGLRVYGLAGARDEEFVRAAGAVFVARADDPAAAIRAVAPDGVDGVLDAVPVGASALGAVRDGGRFVGVLQPLLPAGERGIEPVAVGVRADGARLAELAALVERGELATRVAETLPLDRAGEAHERLAKGGLRGRVVLVP
jgi:NADPH:quinone reductase